MVVLSSSISAKVSKMSCMSARDTSGSAPHHSHPHNNTRSRNEKFWSDQVTVPRPPPLGTTRGGGGYKTVCALRAKASPWKQRKQSDYIQPTGQQKKKGHLRLTLKVVAL